MTLQATGQIAMSDIAVACNVQPNTLIDFSLKVYLIAGTYILGACRGKVGPYYQIYKFDGANGLTTLTDSTNTFSCLSPGTATISTAQSKFGGSSLLINNTAAYFGIANTPTNKTLSSYAGDWTIEGFCYWIGGGTVARFINLPVGTYDSSIRISGTQLHAYYFEQPANTYRSISGGTLTKNVWFHFAFVRSGTTLYLFKDGTQIGTTTITGSAMQMTLFLLGSSGTEWFNGHLDEIRFSTIARYTANFTPPTLTYT